MRCLVATFLFALCASAHADADLAVVRWDQQLGVRLPLDLTFADETGRPTQLAAYFDEVPVVVVFVYFHCEKLCPAVLGGVDEVLHDAGLTANRDYRLLAVSIDPRDTPTQAAHRLRPFASTGVHVLTSSADSAAQLATVAGFRYALTDDAQFAHPAGFLLATPQGTISRYFFGVRYSASQVRDAVASAGNGVAGGLADRLLMVCFGAGGEHSGSSARILIALRTLTIAALVALAIVAWRRYSRRVSQ